MTDVALSKSAESSKHTRQPFTFHFSLDTVFNLRVKICFNKHWWVLCPSYWRLWQNLFSYSACLKDSHRIKTWKRFQLWFNTWTIFSNPIDIANISDFNSIERRLLDSNAAIPRSTSGTNSNNILIHDEAYYSMLWWICHEIWPISEKQSYYMYLSLSIKHTENSNGPKR